LVDRTDMPPGDAGVVEGAVEPAVRADHCLDDRPHIGVVRHVARQRYRLAAGGINLGNGLARGLHRDIGDPDPTPFPSKSHPPSRETASAVARPRPPPAPVISAAFPSSNPGIPYSPY